jgi:hypothetical protein
MPSTTLHAVTDLDVVFVLHRQCLEARLRFRLVIQLVA